MTGEKGHNSAVETVLATLAAPPGAGDPEQLDIEDLLGLPPPPAPEPGAPTPEPRRPGRPPGSRNKRTLDWINYLLSRYASPLEVLAQMTVARVEDLARDLHCTRLEAWQEKRHAAIGLAPFLHQRQPLAVNLTERRVVYLTIEATDTAPALTGEGMVIPVAIVPSDQRLSAPATTAVEREAVERAPDNDDGSKA